jgi:hypothetical protein
LESISAISSQKALEKKRALGRLSDGSLTPWHGLQWELDTNIYLGYMNGLLAIISMDYMGEVAEMTIEECLAYYGNNLAPDG